MIDSAIVGSAIFVEAAFGGSFFWWIPAFAGMTGGAGMTEVNLRLRLLRRFAPRNDGRGAFN